MRHEKSLSITDKENIVKEALKRYSIKKRKVNGMYHVVSLKDKNNVVKKTTVMKKAVNWVIETVKLELEEENTCG